MRHDPKLLKTNSKLSSWNYLGSRDCVPNATDIGPYEEQAQRCGDWAQFTQKEKRGFDKVLPPCPS